MSASLFGGSKTALHVREEEENEPRAHQHSKPEERKGREEGVIGKQRSVACWHGNSDGGVSSRRENAEGVQQ